MRPRKLDAANTAWMLTSSILVLFMTLPGVDLKAIRAGMRVTSEEETEGLDTVLHNEKGYNL